MSLNSDVTHVFDVFVRIKKHPPAELPRPRVARPLCVDPVNPQ